MIFKSFSNSYEKWIMEFQNCGTFLNSISTVWDLVILALEVFVFLIFGVLKHGPFGIFTDPMSENYDVIRMCLAGEKSEPDSQILIW